MIGQPIGRSLLVMMHFIRPSWLIICKISLYPVSCVSCLLGPYMYLLPLGAKVLVGKNMSLFTSIFTLPRYLIQVWLREVEHRNYRRKSVEDVSHNDEENTGV